MGAVSLLAGSWLLQALGPRSSRGAGPPQAPWASAGHSTQAVNTVYVSMVCVSMVCVSTPSRNLASPRDRSVLFHNTGTEGGDPHPQENPPQPQHPQVFWALRVLRCSDVRWTRAPRR